MRALVLPCALLASALPAAAQECPVADCPAPAEVDAAAWDAAPLQPTGRDVEWVVRLATPSKPPASGAPVRLRGLARLTSARWTVSLLADHDDGESIRSGVVDHVKLSATTNLRGVRVVAGAFRPRFGLGLWQGPAAFGRAVHGGSSWRMTSIDPYDGADEAQYQRGIALSASAGSSWTMWAAGSFRRRDARNADSLYVLRDTGYHRTNSEQEGRGALSERSASAAISRTGRVATWALGGGWTSFSDTLLLPSRVEPSAQRATWQLSATMNWSGRQAEMAAEATLVRPGHPAAVARLRVGRARKPAIEISARYLAPRFSAFSRSAGSAWSGERGNEHGLSIRLRLPLSRGWRAALAGDRARRLQPEVPFGAGVRRTEGLMILERRTAGGMVGMVITRRIDYQVESISGTHGAAVRTVQDRATNAVALRLEHMLSVRHTLRLAASVRNSRASSTTTLQAGIQRLGRLRIDAQMAVFTVAAPSLRAGLYRYSVPLDMPLVSFARSGSLVSIRVRGARAQLRLSRTAYTHDEPGWSAALSLSSPRP